jgi:hypothetical protein
MTVHADLLAAADLVATGWTQNNLARTAAGSVVRPDSPVATSWCAAGALQRVTGGAHTDRYKAAWRALWLHVEGDSVAGWNDQSSRTVDEVVAALRAAAGAA